MPPLTQVLPVARGYRVTRDPQLFQDSVVLRVWQPAGDPSCKLATIRDYLEAKRADKKFRLGWIRSMYIDRANNTLVVRTKIRSKYDKKRGRGPVRGAIGSLMPVIDQADQAHDKLRPAERKITKHKLHKWQPKHQPQVRPTPYREAAFVY